ncbi:protein arginine kinase [Syntrophomonas erecta]
MKGNNLLNNTFVKWMESGPESDIVVSSRVRLARNLRGVPFPHLLNDDSGQKCLDQIKAAWSNNENAHLKELEYMAFNQITDQDRQILVEKHLISPNHARSNQFYHGLLVNAEGSMAIMINEEDHLRIQAILPGLQVEECYKRAHNIDDDLEQKLNFAFDERRGYLTSCPTNVGTGMRASVMLHLPAMVMTGQINQIVHNISQLGMAVRGMYGEGTEALGNFFQISNQITLGQTEEDIDSNLTTITRQILEQERILRDNMQNQIKIQLEDRIGRAYGILTNARMINSNEALSHLSDVRLGVEMGMIKDIKSFALNELVVAIRPAHLQKRAGQEMDPLHRDSKRAEVIREKLL